MYFGNVYDMEICDAFLINALLSFPGLSVLAQLSRVGMFKLTSRLPIYAMFKRLKFGLTQKSYILRSRRPAQSLHSLLFLPFCSTPTSSELKESMRNIIFKLVGAKHAERIA